MPPSLSDDDEVQHIPYTKPPPPLIDLLVSSEEDESDQVSVPKKKKKKQSLTSFIPSTVAKSSSSSSLAASPPSAAVNAGKRCEQLVINPVHANAGTGDLNGKGPPSFPSVRVATSSASEPNNNDDALGGSTHDQLGRKTPQVEKSSKRKRTSTSPASSSDASLPARKKHASKQQLSKQRTSQEINNFLVTLGVLGPTTPSSAESPSPSKEKRAKRSKKARRDPPEHEEQDDAMLLDVSVVDTSSSSEKKTKKKKASRSSMETEVAKKASKSRDKEIVGESYEERKLRIKTANQRRSRDRTADVMEIQSEDQIPPPPASDDLLSNQPASSSSLYVDANPNPGMLTRAERAALSFNVSSVLKSPNTLKYWEMCYGDDDDDDSPPSRISPSRGDNRRRRGEVSDRVIDPSIPKSRDGNASTGRGQQNELPSPQPPVYLPSFWTPKMVKFYDTSVNEDFRTSTALATMPDYRGLWMTNEKRLTPNGPKGLRCFNCHEFGHKASLCPETRKGPVCLFCGQSGHGFISVRDREERRFGNPHPCFKAVCLNCGRKQAKYVCHYCAECQVTKRNKAPSCDICELSGHTSSHCPDNWRKFFSTTKGHQNEDGTASFYGDRPVYRLHKDSYCAVCATKGHKYFNCRSTCKTSGYKYSRTNMRIVNELPRLPTKRVVSATAVSSSPVSSSDTVDNARQSCNSEAADETGFENIKSEDDSNKCMDPECRNKLKPKTFCYEVPVADSVEHDLMLKAQNDKGIQNLVRRKAQITVFQARKAIHIYSEDNLGTQSEFLRGIRAMKEKMTKNSPDVIILPPEEAKNAVGDPSPDQLIVSLTETEKRLVQDELLKKDGMFAHLAEKLNVTVKLLSPDSSSVTCVGGTDENRRITRKNIFGWLECKMCNIEYTIQLRLIPNPVTPINHFPPPSKNRKPKSPIKPSRTLITNKQKSDDEIVPITKPAPNFSIWESANPAPAQPTPTPSTWDVFHNNNLSFGDYNNNANNPFNFASQQIPFSNDGSGFYNNFYTGHDFHPSSFDNRPPPPPSQFHYQEQFYPNQNNYYYQNNYVNNPFHQQQYNPPQWPQFVDNGYHRGAGRGRGAPGNQPSPWQRRPNSRWD